MKVVKAFFTLFRGVLYTAIALYLLVAIAPMLFGIQPYMVVSGSMEPTIHTGALAYVNKKDVDVDTGDIIAFTEGDKDSIIVIHRVIENNNDGTFITKGDANDNNDFAPISESQIKGTVIFNIPQLGYITSFLQSTKGIIVAIVLIAIALISSFITDSKDVDPEEPNENTEESRFIENEERKENKQKN